MTGRIKLKKDEYEIYGGVAVIYKRNEYFHYRQWITTENKYIRRTLKTKNKDTAIERAEKLARFIVEKTLNKTKGINFYNFNDIMIK